MENTIAHTINCRKIGLDLERNRKYFDNFFGRKWVRRSPTAKLRNAKRLSFYTKPYDFFGDFLICFCGQMSWEHSNQFINLSCCCSRCVIQQAENLFRDATSSAFTFYKEFVRYARLPDVMKCSIALSSGLWNVVTKRKFFSHFHCTCFKYFLIVSILMLSSCVIPMVSV